MKRRLFALLLVLALCLSICACKKADNQETTGITEPTNLAGTTGNTQKIENTKPSEPAKITEPTKPTEPSKPTEPTPTEPPVEELSVSDWQLEKPNYLSYEEYFSVKRKFANVSTTQSPNEWMKNGQKYCFDKEFPSYKSFLVECYETDAVYVIPNSDAYAKYYVAGADGHYGYLYNENQFVRLDLATGEAEVLLSGQNFASYDIYPCINIYLVDNLIVYYASNVDNQLTIGRLYMPTLKNEILYSTQGEFYNVALGHPKNTQSIVWSMLNPEFISYLKAELADPNSKIQKGNDYDLSEIWKSEDAFTRIIQTPGMQHVLQDAGNIRALMMCTYDLSTKKLTKQTGVVDNCFHGSGMPHDHFNPEVTTAEPVELVMGQWKDMLNKLPDIIVAEETATNALLLPGIDSGRYLYGGDGKKLIDSPVSWAVDTGNGAICISADKRSVFAFSYKDMQPVEIYRSTETDINAPERIFNLDQERKWLVIRDGDALVQMDLAAGKSRVLVRHQYIQPYYYIDHGKTTVYFEISVGLYGTGYTIDMQTGELQKHYRL